MINFLKGKIIYINLKETYLIIDVNNVGYKVNVSIGILTQYQENDIIEIFTHMHVSQDDIRLFGFKNMGHLQFFKKLIQVSGVGPRSALSFFNYKIDDIMKDIHIGNIDSLPKISGIGPKTMQKIILELKGKIGIKTDNNHTPSTNNIKEAMEALINLGFSIKDIENKLHDIDDTLLAEDIIRIFLKK